MIIQAPTRSTRPSMLAGISYFALAFALGFLLGMLRTLFVNNVPGASRLLGVLIELTIMLCASWYLCRYVIRRFAVGSTVSARALMGGIALALLLVAELILDMLLSARAPSEHFALYREASCALGLAAQIGFGLIPMLQIRLEAN
jgi:hypothetical protein